MLQLVCIFTQSDCAVFCINIQSTLGISKSKGFSEILRESRTLTYQRTGLHKGVFVVPEYVNNILGTNSHI